jgi:hypothetical protein
MRSVVPLIFYFVLVGSANGQEALPAFGDVRVKDFEPTLFDSTASSVILFDKGEYGFDGASPIINRHIRVKIIKSNAFKMWGEYRLGDSFTKVSKVKAATYFLDNGELITDMVERDAVIKDVKSGNQKVFALDNLKEDCIIELKFRIVCDYFFMPSWTIQHSVPVLHSEYILLSPAKLKYVVKGGIKPDHFNPNYKQQYTRWIFKNIDGMREEPLMPSQNNFLAEIVFGSPFISWDEFGLDYLKKFESTHEKFKPRFLERKVNTLLASVSDPLQKIKELCAFVKKEYQWTGVHDCLAVELLTIFENRKGSSGDLNIMLFEMLRLGGFDPQFVLLSTNDNGKVIRTLPSHGQFNNVLCSVEINGKMYLLDVTSPSLPFDVVPLECVNNEGLRIRGARSEWINIEPVLKEKINVNAWFSVSEDRVLTGKVTVAANGYDGYEIRKKYTEGQSDKLSKSEMLPDFWQTDSLEVKNMTNFEVPAIVSFYGTMTGKITEAGQNLYINPYLVFTENGVSWRNNTRQFPIYLGLPIEKRLIFNLEIPSGYKVKSLPSSQSFSLPDKSISCLVKSTANEKNVAVTFLLEIRKNWFEVSDFGNLRQFFHTVISRQNELIILSK